MAGASMNYATATGTTKSREGKDVPAPRRGRCRSKDKGRTATVTLEFSKPTSRAFVQELIEREYRTERLARTRPPT